MTDLAKCHWNGTTRVTQQHLRDCNNSGCDGCKPCTLTHCTMPRCSRHLGDHETGVCHRCVGDVRTGIARIRDLCILAPHAAAEPGTGIHSAIAVLVGPVPEHSTHAARHTWAIRALCTCGTDPDDCPDNQPAPIGPLCEKSDTCIHAVCRRATWRPTCPGLSEWLEYADDEQHPLWVLGAWDIMVTGHLGHHRTNRVTLAGATSYITANLTDLARDPDFPFDELAKEINDCKTHVEEVMGVAPHQQKGVPCPTCYEAGRPAKPLIRKFNLTQPDDRRDSWICLRAGCDEEMTLDDYAKHVYVKYLERAEKLTAAQIQAQYRVPEGTLRRWANGWTTHVGDAIVEHAPIVRKRGYDQANRQLYDVADVKAARERGADTIRKGA